MLTWEEWNENESKRMKRNENEWKEMELKGMNQMNQLIKCNINLMET